MDTNADLLRQIGTLRGEITQLKVKITVLRKALSLYVETDGNIEAFKTMDQYERAMERAYQLATATLDETK